MDEHLTHSMRSLLEDEVILNLKTNSTTTQRLNTDEHRRNLLQPQTS